MKKFILLSVFAVLVSCQKSEIISISVEQYEYEVTDAYTELNIPVKCSVASKASIEYEGDEDGWIFLLPSVLNGNGVYSLWIDAYDNVLEDREAKLLITAGTETTEVLVRQLSKASIGLSPMNLVPVESSGTYPVNVTCKREWSASVDEDAASWCSIDKTSGNGPGVINVTLSDLGNKGPLTGHITFISGTLEIKLTVQHGYAQNINGVIWSKANVDNPGYFGETPDTRGLLYQYDSKIGWPNSSPETSGCPDGMRVGQYDSGVSDWSVDNDPCPEGWRVPSIEEIRALIGDAQDRRFIWHEPESSGFSIPGAIAGISAEEASSATEEDMKGGIFIPQTGCRNKDTGNQDNWWSACMTSRTRPGQNWDRYVCWMDYQNNFDYNGFDGNAAAYPVRCVAVTK